MFKKGLILLASLAIFVSVSAGETTNKCTDKTNTTCCIEQCTPGACSCESCTDAAKNCTNTEKNKDCKEKCEKNKNTCKK